jgi:hypothetical protein
LSSGVGASRLRGPAEGARQGERQGSDGDLLRAGEEAEEGAQLSAQLQQLQELGSHGVRHRAEPQKIYKSQLQGLVA